MVCQWRMVDLLACRHYSDYEFKRAIKFDNRLLSIRLMTTSANEVGWHTNGYLLAVCLDRLQLYHLPVDNLINCRLIALHTYVTSSFRLGRILQWHITSIFSERYSKIFDSEA